MGRSCRGRRLIHYNLLNYFLIFSVLHERRGGDALRWVFRLLKASTALVSIYVLSVAVLLLPAGLVRSNRSTFLGFAGSRYDPDRYWEVLKLHLGELARGNVFMKLPERAGRPPEPAMLMEQAQVTFAILAGGILLSLVLGAVVGYLLSRHAPRWLRSPAWVWSTFMLSLPDLLMVVLLQLLVYYGGRHLGIHVPVYGGVMGANSWLHFVVPVTALSLLGVPYVARIVAAALEEVGGQPFVQAARARGLSVWTIQWRYVGRNAMVRAWGTLPAALGVLLSAEPIVEYFTDMPGLGRQLIRSPVGYGAALTLLPLLVAMTGLHTAVRAGVNWVNPAQTEDQQAPLRMRSRRRLWDGLSALGGAWRSLGEVVAWAIDLIRCVPGWPGGLWRALRTNRLLLCGTILVTGFVTVALFAHELAPFAWEQREPIRMGEGTIMAPPFPPNDVNPLGSDSFGRDMLSRLIWGTRFALLFALLAVPLRFAIALPLGMAAAYLEGWLARVVQNVATVFTSLPAVLLPLTLIPGLNNIFTGQPWPSAIAGILVIALPGAPRLAEAVRLRFREVLSRPFVEGAEAAGAGGTRVLLRHVLPHVTPSLAAMAALEVPVIMTVTAFLGLRQAYVGGTMWDPEKRIIIGPYMPEWGAMVPSPFQLFAQNKWWLWLPFAALFLAVLAFTLLGEGIRRQALRDQ